MSRITVREIQDDPSGFIRRVENGETLVVVRDHRPFAEIKPLSLANGTPRPFGLCSGQFTVPADFDSPLPEDVLNDFES
jgi:antitoxin (DNA-binding transcriptional repressor) of toxin-antitoxin stability system